MADLFDGSGKKLAGIFKGSTLALAVAAGGSVFGGALVQDVQMQYNRQVNRIFSLGSNDMYYNLSPAMGTGMLDTIVGPKTAIADMLAALGGGCFDPANKTALTVTADPNAAQTCGVGGAFRAVASDVILDAVRLNMSVQDFMIHSGGQFSYTSLDLQNRNS